MKKFMAILILVVAVLAFGVAAYAEVQNIKVSGALTTRAFGRLGYPNLQTTYEPLYDHADTFVMTTTEIGVAADLTDNVSANVVLANEKDWGYDAGNRLDQSNVDVEKAYVTLKEFFYQPLTVVVGRQDLWYGKGFIVGYNRNSWDMESAMGAPEYSVMGAFDAVKAVLDFKPWTFDVFYSTIREDRTYPSIIFQQNMLGTNVNYKFSEYNAEIEGYMVYVRRNNGEGDINGSTSLRDDTPEQRTINTAGLRGQVDPIANMTLYGEAAYQWGKYVAYDEVAAPSGASAEKSDLTIRKRSAMAADVGGEYRFADYAWQPKIGVEYIFYSGDKNPWGADGKYRGWDPVFRGKFDTAIRDFMGMVYQTADRFDTPAYTNQHQIAVEGAIRPIQALEIYGRYTYFRLHKSLSSAVLTGSSVDTFYKVPVSRSKEIGSEIDVKLTYDYTEDVQFGLLTAWFLPGDYYKKATGSTYTNGASSYVDIKSRKTLSEIVGSVKVSF